MEPGLPAREQGSVPKAAAEIEITSGSSNVPSTTELLVQLSESRREAELLRRELADARKKADEDQRRLQALSRKSPDPQVRIFQERLARAEAALEDAETRNRFVERNWLQVERYLIIIQQQAADSRVAFSRLMEQNDGRLVLPTESHSTRRRDIPLGEYISSSGSGQHTQSRSTVHRDLPSTSSHCPRSPEYVRPPLPLITPRRPPSPPMSGVTDPRRTKDSAHQDEEVNSDPGLPKAPRHLITAARIHYPLLLMRLAINTILSARAIRPASTCLRHQRSRAETSLNHTAHRRRCAPTMRGIPRFNSSSIDTHQCPRVPPHRQPPRRQCELMQTSRISINIVSH
ncbi:hypothetical protein K438DRAFT_2013510 [Mycena galopus ATCC 62051]|nr:hypothetical protein K438DRAFT_2013510 [Mycena galopus ATCC 62051]